MAPGESPSGPALSLVECARLVDHPPPIHWQRVAARLQQALAADARNAGILPTRLGGPPLDVLDALSFELIITGGGLVGATALLDAAARASVACLDCAHVTPTLATAAAHLRRDGVDVALRARTGGAPPRWRETAALARGRVEFMVDPGGEADAPDVLVVAQQPGHLADARPVLRRLREDHDLRCALLVADRRTAQAAGSAGETVVWPYPDRRTRASILAGSVGLRRRLLGSARSSSGRFGATETPLLQRAFAAALGPILSRHLARVLAVAAVVESQARRGLRLVVAVNPYDQTGRTAAQAAAAGGVPSAGLEHGSILARNPLWEECPVGLMCVWGEPSRRALQSSGYEGRIEVTGSPRFDELGTPHPGAPEASTILVASSGPGIGVALEQHAAFVELLYEAAASRPDIRWVARLHPKDRRVFYDDASVHFPAARVDVEEPGHDPTRSDIYRDLSGAAALVTVQSTAAVDAARAGVPVIAVRAERSEDGLAEFVDRTASRTVATASQLADAAAEAVAGRLPPAADPGYVHEHVAFTSDGAARTASALAAAAR